MENRERRDFIVPQPEKPKSVKEYESAELREDISVFPEDARPLVEKYLAGQKLGPYEQGTFDMLRSIWWFNKYGFPYKNQEARGEMLRRKYATEVELTSAQKLQEDFFLAVRNNDQAKIAELRALYAEQYPDQLEGITILFELPEFFKEERAVYKQHEDYLRKIEYLTQYRFLVNDFIINNGAQKEFLKIFWQALERIANESGNLQRLREFQMSTANEVAVFKVFSALGYNPRVAHPKEDAFHAIDLWIGDKGAVQIKGREKAVFFLYHGDTIAFPSTQIRSAGKLKFFTSRERASHSKFKAKADEYASLLGEKLTSYYMVVPFNSRDSITGEPSTDFIEKVKEVMSSAVATSNSPEAARQTVEIKPKTVQYPEKQPIEREKPRLPDTEDNIVRFELAVDIFKFSKKDQPVIKKFVRRMQWSSPAEHSQFERARKEWWRAKYGFSYHDKARRLEALAKNIVKSLILNKNYF